MSLVMNRFPYMLREPDATLILMFQAQTLLILKPYIFLLHIYSLKA